MSCCFLKELDFGHSPLSLSKASTCSLSPWNDKQCKNKMQYPLSFHYTAKLNSKTWKHIYPSKKSTPFVPKYKIIFHNLSRLRKLVKLVIYTWYYQFILTNSIYHFPHSPSFLVIIDKHCRVNLGKNWEMLENDLVSYN